MMQSDVSHSGESANSNDRIDLSTIHQPASLLVGHNRWEWGFLIIGLLNAGLLITPSAIIIFNKTCPFDVLNYCFLMEIIICITSVFALVFAAYGVFYEHMYDMYIHSAWVGISLYFSWISYILGVGSIYHIRMILNSVCVGTFLIGFIFTFKSTNVPDWIEYRLPGVSEPLVEMYKSLCQFLVLLKFNSLLMVIYSLYSSHASFGFDSWCWYGFQGLVVLYAFLIWLLGKITVHKEVNWLVYAFYTVNSCFLICISWQLCWELFKLPDDPYKLKLSATSAAFGIIFVINQCNVLVRMKSAHSGFGYGLNSRSFLDLVTRNSKSLLASPRSDVLF